MLRAQTRIITNALSAPSLFVSIAFLLFACVVSLILQVRSRYLSSRQRPTVSDHNDENAAQTLHAKASIQHEIDLLQKLLDEKQRSITQIDTKLGYNSGGGLNGSPSTPRRRTRREQSRSQTPTTSLSLSPRNRGLLDIIPRDSPRERWSPVGSPLGSPSMRSATKYVAQTATSPASPTASTTNDIAIEFGQSNQPQDAVAIEIAPSRPSSPAPQHRTSGSSLTQQPSMTRSHSSSLTMPTMMKTPIINSTARRSHKPSRKKSDMAEAFDSFNLYHSIKQQRSRQHQHNTPQHIRTDYDRPSDDHTSWSLPISPPLLSLSSPTAINSSHQNT